MSVGRLQSRTGNLCRRISRLLGAPEISPRRIRSFLERFPESSEPMRDEIPPSSLAVVIPCYGHAEFLNAALESIANQTRLPDEVVAVNDHSPDQSVAVLERQFSRLRELNVRCTLLNNDRNRGQAFSLNRGIADVESKLVMILNDDDYLMHDAVDTVLDVFKLRAEVVMVGGTSIHFCSDGDLAQFPAIGRTAARSETIPLHISTPVDVRGYRYYNDLNMTHSGCCFLKSVWEKVGGYYPEKGKRLVPFSDRDFQLRVNALFPVAVSPVIPFSFWRSGSSVDQGRDS
ncbi:MAG: glycosyltransferase family A protein [Desulfuromonadaceae bacterium]|nr:glycosyltransferase family A protein [Desulfuromonadaceae bacterium]